MRIIEFGPKDKPILVLIHGFESMYQIWDEYISIYQDDYHILIPILPSHDKELIEEFTSFDKIVIELEEYIKKYQTDVYAVYGMSMGGILATKLFERKIININKLILDGTPLLGMSSSFKKIFINQYLKITHKAKNRDKKTIKKAIKSIVPNSKLYFFLDVMDVITDTSIVNYINEVAGYKLSIIDSKTNIYYFRGTKMNEMLAKKSAKFLRNNYVNVNIIINENTGHCELAIFKPYQMIEKLNSILK